MANRWINCRPIDFPVHTVKHTERIKQVLPFRLNKIGDRQTIVHIYIYVYIEAYIGHCYPICKKSGHVHSY